MERQEPRLDSDMSGIEFRTPHRPARPPSRGSDRSDAFALKIGLAVGGGVLVALLIFNAYERYQARRDAERALRMLDAQMKEWDREIAQTERLPGSTRPRTPAQTIHPLPPGYRCTSGVLLYREQTGWTQITARSRHTYCPHGGSVRDCYPVTPRSVGCGA